MNHMHAESPEWAWSEIPAERFEALMNIFDYYRDNWSDVTMYRQRHGGEDLGFFTARNPQRHFVRPDILARADELAAMKASDR